ncbi:MAG: hypothetical protein HN909_02575 [Phycisphaerales bacterium]|nr:hypothetical protein [Phycisphaerales bacterium]MBT7170636.1 hypothetical protein [Phycisphaerales bacterium]
MLWKRILGLAIVLFAAGSLVYSFTTDPYGHLQPYKPPRDGVVVYYFLVGSKRCDTCKNIEAYTRAAAQTAKAEAVVFALVNADAEANAHFRDPAEFNLAGKSVVVARYADGKLVKSVKCKKIWTWVHQGQDVFVAGVHAALKSVAEGAEE